MFNLYHAVLCFFSTVNTVLLSLTAWIYFFVTLFSESYVVTYVFKNFFGHPFQVEFVLYEEYVYQILLFYPANSLFCQATVLYLARTHGTRPVHGQSVIQQALSAYCVMRIRGSRISCSRCNRLVNPRFFVARQWTDPSVVLHIPNSSYFSYRPHVLSLNLTGN